MRTCSCSPVGRRTMPPPISGDLRPTGGGGQPERPRAPERTCSVPSLPCMRAAPPPAALARTGSNAKAAQRGQRPTALVPSFLSRRRFSHGTLFQSWRLTHRSRWRARRAELAPPPSPCVGSNDHDARCMPWPGGRLAVTTLWIVALSGEIASAVHAWSPALIRSKRCQASKIYA